MTKDDLYARIEEYIAGTLTPGECAEIERMIANDAELADLVRFSVELDGSLRDQSWLKPAPGFTVRAMARAGLIQSHPIPVWSLTWQRLRAWLPIAVAGAFVVMNLGMVMTWVRAILLVVGSWLSGVTGVPELAIHPVIGVAVLSSLVAVAMATCVVSGKCRITN